MAERKFYVVEKDDKGELDIAKLNSLSATIQEKLNEEYPVSVCKRKDSGTVCFVVLAVSAYDAKTKYENCIHFENRQIRS